MISVLVNFNNIPFDTNPRQWVLWDYEDEGRTIKVPRRVDGTRADLTKPETWEKFEDVCKVAEFYDGIGFVFTLNSGIMSRDFDQVKERIEWDSKAMYELQSLNLYAEFSPNQKRIYVYEKGKKPETWKEENFCRIINIEGFSSVTGEQTSEVPEAIDKKAKDVEKLDKLYTIVEGPLLEPNKDRCLILYGNPIPNSVLKEIQK